MEKERADALEMATKKTA